MSIDMIRIGPTGHAALAYIAEHEGCTQGEAGRAAGSTSTTDPGKHGERAVTRLVRDGYVTRTPRDGGGWHLSITSTGRALLSALTPAGRPFA